MGYLTIASLSALMVSVASVQTAFAIEDNARDRFGRPSDGPLPTTVTRPGPWTAARFNAIITPALRHSQAISEMASIDDVEGYLASAEWSNMKDQLQKVTYKSRAEEEQMGLMLALSVVQPKILAKTRRILSENLDSTSETMSQLRNRIDALSLLAFHFIVTTDKSQNKRVAQFARAMNAMAQATKLPLCYLAVAPVANPHKRILQTFVGDKEQKICLQRERNQVAEQYRQRLLSDLRERPRGPRY